MVYILIIIILVIVCYLAFVKPRLDECEYEMKKTLAQFDRIVKVLRDERVRDKDKKNDK